MDNKCQQFKKMLMSEKLEFILEAHNGLSAKIVEESGFKGIWASGLAISAALGVRDCNEASWTQVMDVLEFMSDATKIPIMVDADTGYGNFNNVRRLVQKLEKLNVAAMCIEDKLFPKMNSFVSSEQQSLADIEEFSGRIRAAKDTQREPDFCVIARTEALIVGKGLSEALRRAEAYFRAGADAILVHSKLSVADQIFDFANEWKNACPIVVVPTTYYKTPTQKFADAGISMVIWANHLVRASIMSMQKIAARLFETQSLVSIDGDICSVKEIFRLQDVEELKNAEKKYLPEIRTTN